MAPTSTVCQNCKKSFRIEVEDFLFYEKIKVPPPTWCPQCRNVRRLAWREDHTLYKDSCQLCDKPVLSIHVPSGPFTVYCRDCWRSDKWDPLDYGRDYDFSKPFFSQYRELMEAVPRPALTGTNIVNSEYSHASFNCKNCYFVFWSYFAEDSQYSYGLLLSRNTYDSYATDNSDHAYETFHCNRIYQVRFGFFAEECMNSSFLYDCVGCTDCFGCINLRKQKYCIFNEQLDKEEYSQRIAYWDLGSYTRLEEAKQKFQQIHALVPHRAAHITSSVNVSGDIIRDTKDCFECFSVLDGVEHCRYIYGGGLHLKDSYDVNYGGDLSELLYETMGVTSSQKCFFSGGLTNSREIQYSDWTNNCANCFGNIALKNKKYCILNKQYEKEAYKKLVAEIIKHMNAMPYVDKRGRTYQYGEFFPTEISAYAYNETVAFTWNQKDKSQVITEGYRWQDHPERHYQITKKAEDLPDHIKETEDSILQETIGCLHGALCKDLCIGAFRITPAELAFYRSTNVALPRLCPNCRSAERFRWRNEYRLWQRQCGCGTGNYQNNSTHFHGHAPCLNTFSTTYPPHAREIVYCDQCYKAEFL